MDATEFVVKQALDTTKQAVELTDRDKHLIGLAVTLTRGCQQCTGSRIENALADNGHLAPLGIDPPKEAAAVALVAGGPTDLLDLDQQRVFVAVEVDFLELLNVAALLTLAPQLLTAAAVVADAACR